MKTIPATDEEARAAYADFGDSRPFDGRLTGVEGIVVNWYDTPSARLKGDRKGVWGRLTRKPMETIFGNAFESFSGPDRSCFPLSPMAPFGL